MKANVQGPSAMPNTQAEDEGSEEALALHPHLARAGEGHGNHVQEHQPHEEEDRGDEVVTPGPDVPHHAPRDRRDRTNDADGDQDADREEGGDGEGPAGLHLPLLANEPDDQGMLASDRG